MRKFILSFFCFILLASYSAQENKVFIPLSKSDNKQYERRTEVESGNKSFEVTTVREETNKDKLDDPIIITQPIRATKSTDPNKEINAQKSQETKSRLDDRAINGPIKGLTLEQQIADLKAKIFDVENNPSKEGVNPEKLDSYKQELILLENRVNN